MWTKSFENAKVKGYITDEHRNRITLSAKEKWKNRRFERTIKELSQFDDEKPEELGRSLIILIRIIRIQLRLSRTEHRGIRFRVYKQLPDGYEACKTTLSLIQLQRDRLIGLASILYLSLQNCSAVTMVKSSIYDDNTKCAADTYAKFLL